MMLAQKVFYWYNVTMYQLSYDNLIVLLVMLLWVLPWKGYALWTASKKDHKIWFVILLVINTLSVLEIIYIFAVAKKNWSDIKRTLHGIFSGKPKKTEPTPEPISENTPS